MGVFDYFPPYEFYFVHVIRFIGLVFGYFLILAIFYIFQFIRFFMFFILKVN